jgi:hypothetical protein
MSSCKLLRNKETTSPWSIHSSEETSVCKAVVMKYDEGGKNMITVLIELR